MKLIKLTLLIAAVTLSIVACNSGANTNQTANSNAAQTPAASPTAAANTASQPADEFASVRPIYAETCARCHKIDGEGGPVEVRGKKLNVPSFKKGHALKHTDEEFAKQIAEGGEGMPAFKDRLKPEQINDLVRFIRKEFQSSAATPTQK